MARLLAPAQPARERVPVPVRQDCPGCGGPMRLRYENRRTLVTPSGAVRLRLKIRRCEHEGCARHRVAYRPEAEGAMALSRHEFGLDVVALVGVLRHRHHRSVREIHAVLRGRGAEIAERSVTSLLDRYAAPAHHAIPAHLRPSRHQRPDLGQPISANCPADSAGGRPACGATAKPATPAALWPGPGRGRRRIVAA